MREVRRRIFFLEDTLQKAERRENKYEDELKTALAQYQKLREQAKDMDADTLNTVSQEIRPDMEREAYQ